MKKTKYNNQLPQHLYSYWLNGSDKAGFIIKKKLYNQFKYKLKQIIKIDCV